MTCNRQAGRAGVHLLPLSRPRSRRRLVSCPTHTGRRTGQSFYVTMGDSAFPPCGTLSLSLPFCHPVHRTSVATSPLSPSPQPATTTNMPTLSSVLLICNAAVNRRRSSARSFSPRWCCGAFGRTMNVYISGGKLASQLTTKSLATACCHLPPHATNGWASLTTTTRSTRDSYHLVRFCHPRPRPFAIRLPCKSSNLRLA